MSVDKGSYNTFKSTPQPSDFYAAFVPVVETIKLLYTRIALRGYMCVNNFQIKPVSLPLLFPLERPPSEPDQERAVVMWAGVGVEGEGVSLLSASLVKHFPLIPPSSHQF